MSHVATIDIVISDLDALEAACKENGWRLMRGQKTYKWYGTWVNDYHGADAAYKHGVNPKSYGKCEHAIKVGGAGAYEIGVSRNEAGDLVLIWDFYGGSIEKACGKDCHKLFESYTKHVVTKKMKAKGYSSPTITTNADGETELIFTSYS